MEREKVDLVAKEISELLEYIRQIFEIRHNCKIKAELKISVDDADKTESGG
jgi:hypothetical protein